MNGRSSGHRETWSPGPPFTDTPARGHSATVRAADATNLSFAWAALQESISVVIGLYEGEVSASRSPVRHGRLSGIADSWSQSSRAACCSRPKKLQLSTHHSHDAND